MLIKNINKKFIVGDLHGELEIAQKLNASALENVFFEEDKDKNNIIFQVGDFGIIWDITPSKTEKYWLKWLDNKPFYTLFIAGNHDNFERLEGYPLIDFHGGKAAQISEKVFYLKNGYVYEFDYQKFWLFGGATSIDKENRQLNISWWQQETSSYSEMQLGLDSLEKNNYEVDYIMTHTMPSLMIGRFSDFREKVNCPVARYLDVVLERVHNKYRHWYCGHFHEDKELDANLTIVYNKIIRI